jgi:DNA recombination protein RmuC
MINPVLALSVVSLVLLLLVFGLAYRLYLAKIELEKTKAQLNVDDVILDRFRAIASQTLEGNSKQFLELAKSTLEKENIISKSVLEKENANSKNELEKSRLEIHHLVDPLNKKLEEYQIYFQKIESERQRSYSKVEEELKRVAEIGNVLNKETSILVNALKKPHVRGRWGEVQLKNCIDLAGMSEYADVTFQDNTTLDDGQRLIPDMTVRMPGGRVVVVDAKTPIDAFLSSLEATDAETRASEIARHGRHVREHIKKLAAKSYSDNLKDSADFTVLFLPNESFLYAALETEPDIMEFAIQKKILMATPPTLIGLLKVIRFGWNEERLAENAQKISEVGAELHKRMVDFTDAFIAIGKNLDKAKLEYDSGLSRLQSRVVPQARKLEQLGAKSIKSLPLELSE